MVFAHGPEDAAKDQLGEFGVGVMLGLMAEGDVPLAATIELVTPGQGELVAELFAWSSVSKISLFVLSNTKAL